MADGCVSMSTAIAMLLNEPSLAVWPIWLIRLSVLSAIAYLSTRFSRRTSLLEIVATISCVSPLAISWLLTVTENVPEPYLVRVLPAA